MHPAIRVCHFVSSTSRCWSRACMCCPRAVARSVGLVRRHRCPRTQTRSVTLGVRGSPAPWSAVRPVRASTRRHFVFDYLRLPIVTVACSTPGLYRTLPTYRSVGASAMRCGGWRVVTSFTRVTLLVFDARLGPRSGRQEPVAFYLLKQSRSRDSSAPAAVRGVAAPASRRAVPCGLRLGYVL